MILAAADPWILTFSLVTVLATIAMGFWSAGKSKTAGDFFVAGRSVSVGWNASAISGEYLSAASFMGVAGMVMTSGYDALWYPVCYACGYLFLLLFIAGPLRRFGAYTIPDFAEGRYDSTLFRKIAVIFVLFIGFFYTMPQMKGAGTTLAYIFPGLPYWAGVVVVGAVITLNVSLWGHEGDHSGSGVSILGKNVCDLAAHLHFDVRLWRLWKESFCQWKRSTRSRGRRSGSETTA
jgi:Na+(H+)/acetate symporter ActP